MRWLGAVLVLLGCGAEAPTPGIRTISLPAPELTQPAFEPHVAIDPAAPNRIIVAAQYGVSRNRGGRRIWTWSSDDGGRTWNGAELPLPGGPRTTKAADPITAFAPDGTALVGFLFADSTNFEGGLAISRSGPGNLQLGPAAIIARDQLRHGGGAIDKGWVAVDRGPTSPLRGTVYLTWHVNRPLPGRQVESTVWIGSSARDGQWNEARPVGHYFGAQPAARRDGTVDLVFADPDSRRLLHAASTDGAGSFPAPDTVAVAAVSEMIDLPSLAVTADDRLVTCWTQGPGDVPTALRVHCGTSDGRGPWEVVDLDSAGRAASGMPGVAANEAGIWVAAYTADSATVELVLYRGDDGRSFTRYATLATRPFGLARFCPAPGAACRRTLEATGAYFPGDYLGIATGPGIVAVAFAVPEGPDPSSRSTIHLSIIRP